MKKGFAWLCTPCLVILVAVGLLAQVGSDIQSHPSCSHCGMNRQQFAHSRMLVLYDDGSVVPTCSLHCAALDLAINIDKTPKAVQVADYKSKALIDAESATWVIGGKLPGVMTKRAKWAFASRPDAETFIKENGGTVGVFDDAVKATFEDMYSDAKMIREKRKMNRQMRMKDNPMPAHKQ